MAESVRIEVDKSGLKGLDKLGPLSIHELIKTVEQIGNITEHTASAFAPMGEKGAIKRHPVDSTTIRGVGTANPLFGGGFAIRGPQGFVPGRGSEADIGNAVVIINMTIPDSPFYAKFVAGGTGLYGNFHHVIVPVTAKFMKFRYDGRKFRLKTVKGQRPQPYLTEAYEVVDRLFVPIEVEKLRAKLKAIS